MSSYEVYPIIVPYNNGLRSVNFYIVKNGQSLILIDAGFNDEACWNALNDTLYKHQFSITDLTEIVLTHHHIDHVGLVNRITDIHPIPIYASPLSIHRLKKDQEFLLNRIDFFADLYKKMGCGNDGEKYVTYLHQSFEENKNKIIHGEINTLTEKDSFPLKVIEVPGHAEDQLAFSFEKDKALIVGDLLIDHISTNALVEPDKKGNRIRSLTQHIDSLKKCMSLEVETVYSGHGKTITNPRQLIEKRLNGIEEKVNRMLQLIKEGIQTGSDLAKKLYPKQYHKQFYLVMSEIIGHLDYMEENYLVGKTIKNGIFHYETI